MRPAPVQPVRIAIFVAVLFASSIPDRTASAQHAEPAREDAPVLIRTLPNGLTVLVKENHAAPVVSLRIYVRNTGSLYEGEFLGAGISHYYEHLLHGGSTTNVTEEEGRRTLESIGGLTNAYTTKDHTCYYITTASAYFEPALKLFADWMQYCKLETFEVEREKQVIIQEFGKNADEPRRVLYDLFYDTMFRVHPTRIPVIGYKSNFLAITREDLVAFYERRYVPDNTVVVVTGDLAAEQTVEQVASAFSAWERGPNIMPILPKEPPQSAPREARVEKDTNVTYLRAGWHTVDLFHEDLFALDVLATILATGDSSRLVKRLRDELGLVHSVSAWSSTPEYGGGAFAISAVLEPVKEQEVLRAIGDELQKLEGGDSGPTEAELARAKVQIESAYVFGAQTVEDQAARLGGNFLSTGDPAYDKTYLAGIRAVTEAQLRTVADKYLRPANLTVVAVVPRGTIKAGSAAAEAAASRLPVAKITLANGLRILLKRNPATPAVHIAARALGGVLIEHEHDNGIGALTVRTMVKGTATRSADDIADLIDSRGGSIGAAPGNNSTAITMDLVSKDCEAGLELLADILKNASFPEDQLQRQRELLLAAIRRRKDDWGSESTDFFRQSFFAKHPYRLKAAGSEEAVARFTREELEAWYRRTWTGPNTVVSVYGDFDPEFVGARLSKLLADYRPGEPLALDLPAEQAADTDRLALLFNRKQQAVLAIGYPGPTLSDNERYVLDVIDAFSSGVRLPSGRFHEALRGRENLVYYIHAIHWPGVGAGAFYLHTQCSVENLDKVYGILRDEIRKIVEGPIAPQELENAKRICITAHQVDRQTNEGQATADSMDELLGLGYDHHLAYPLKIEAVTMEQVVAACKRTFGHALIAVTLPESAKEHRFEVFPMPAAAKDEPMPEEGQETR